MESKIENDLFHTSNIFEKFLIYSKQFAFHTLHYNIIGKLKFSDKLRGSSRSVVYGIRLYAWDYHCQIERDKINLHC